MRRAAPMVKERQGIEIADFENLRTIEVGNAIRRVHRGFIIVGRNYDGNGGEK